MNRLYAVLEIEPTASEDEIKQSYRRLAMKYHPDKNPSPEAKGKFQEISSAYQTLSDPNKRRQYDLSHKSFPSNHFQSGPFQSGSEPVYDTTSRNYGVFYTGFGNILDHIFTSNQIDHTLVLSYPEFINGCQRTVKFDERVHVDRSGQPLSPQACNMCRGQARFMSSLGIVCRNCQGTGQIFPPGSSVQIQSKTVRLNIPAGTWPDQIVTLQGRRIQLSAQPTAQFYHEGSNLFYIYSIDLFKALLGIDTEIKIGSNSYSIRHPDPITFETELVFSGEGLDNSSGRCGDLIVVFDLIFPTNLTEYQRKYVRKCGSSKSSPEPKVHSPHDPKVHLPTERSPHDPKVHLPTEPKVHSSTDRSIPESKGHSSKYKLRDDFDRKYPLD